MSVQKTPQHTTSDTTRCPGAPRARRVQIGGSGAFRVFTPRRMFPQDETSECPGAPCKRDKPVSLIRNPAVRRRLF